MSGHKKCIVCGTLLENTTICINCVEKAKNYAICKGCDKFEKYTGKIVTAYFCSQYQKEYTLTQSDYSKLHFLTNRGIPNKCKYRTEHIIANCAMVDKNIRQTNIDR